MQTPIKFRKKLFYLAFGYIVYSYISANVKGDEISNQFKTTRFFVTFMSAYVPFA